MGVCGSRFTECNAPDIWFSAHIHAHADATRPTPAICQPHRNAEKRTQASLSASVQRFGPHAECVVAALHGLRCSSTAEAT